MKRNLLIVGCGDVARRALPGLTKTFEVTALARTPESAAAVAKLGVRVVQGDLDRPETLQPEVWRAHSVLHCAPPQSDGSTDARTRSLLEALGRGMVPQRFVYLSTTGVYGDCAGDRVDETHALNPQSDRAHRRVDAERQLETFAAAHGARLTILRVPGIYAEDRLPLERLKRGTVALRPEDDVYTNHIHARDLAAIVVRAVEPNAPCGVFNASDDSEIRMGDYFDLVADRFHLPRPPRVDRAEALRRLSPELVSFMSESRRLDNGRLKLNLGVRLQFPTVYEGVPVAGVV